MHAFLLVVSGLRYEYTAVSTGVALCVWCLSVSLSKGTSVLFFCCFTPLVL